MITSEKTSGHRACTVRPTRLIIAALLFALCALWHGSEAQVKEEKQDAAGAGLTERDRQATLALIGMTRDAETLCGNFDEILTDPPPVDTRLDDALLREESMRRFYWVSWPQDSPLEDKQWGKALPSARLQALCWLAECNKRMCLDIPQVRARQREALLTLVKDGLKAATDPEEIRGLLDVAFRTVFYRSPVIPTDGADEIIDLFKGYVGHANPSVHEFARERLRVMGYVWRPRYDEILQFLIEKAPEIREYLTAKPVPGIAVDILLGGDYRAGLFPERDWCAVDHQQPDILANLVEERLDSYRSQDALGQKALSKLLKDSKREDGELALRAIVGLVKKGIQPGHIVYVVAVDAAKNQPLAESQLAQRRLDEVLRAFQEAARSNWPAHTPEPAQVLENIRNTLKQAREKRSREGEPLPEAASLQAEQRLAEAIQALAPEGE